jgi:hypothetical protein
MYVLWVVLTLSTLACSPSCLFTSLDRYLRMSTAEATRPEGVSNAGSEANNVDIEEKLIPSECE